MLPRSIRQTSRLVSVLLAVRVLDRDDILGVAPFARYLELLEVGGDTRIDQQAFVSGADAQDML